MNDAGATVEYHGILITAVDSRFKASVIAGGGLVPGVKIPEIDLLNFAPRVQVPTLMVNGRSDFTYPLETSQVPLFHRLGLPADRKKHQTFEGGHIPLRIHDWMRAILDWFDTYLGPVS